MTTNNANNHKETPNDHKEIKKNNNREQKIHKKTKNDDKMTTKRHLTMTLMQTSSEKYTTAK